jgi:hypothetical protein
MNYNFDEYGTFDFSGNGRRPSASQIVAAWKRAGRPSQFAVTYGETYARFDLQGGRWFGSGNGQRGVRRDAVERALNGEAV